MTNLVEHPPEALIGDEGAFSALTPPQFSPLRLIPPLLDGVEHLAHALVAVRLGERIALVVGQAAAEGPEESGGAELVLTHQDVRRRDLEATLLWCSFVSLNQSSAEAETGLLWVLLRYMSSYSQTEEHLIWRFAEKICLQTRGTDYLS